MTLHRPSNGITAPARRLAPTALALVALGGLLSACSSGVDRTVATSAIPTDFHQRHPVVLADAPRSLDIFVGSGNRLDERQRHDLESFAAEYRAQGRGRIRVLVPRGVDPAAADATLMAVRRGLVAAGVTGSIEVGTYRVADPRLASALRLSFLELQAGTATPCGDWPEDLGSRSVDFGLENRTYYNLGCANQQTLAAQTADPRDLVRPRAEEPGDVYMRIRPLKDIRGDITSATPQGQDPSTTWTQSKLVPIGGGQ